MDTQGHMGTHAYIQETLDTGTHMQVHKPHPESHTKPQGSDMRSYTNTKYVSLTMATDTPKHAQTWGRTLAGTNQLQLLGKGTWGGDLPWTLLTRKPRLRWRGRGSGRPWQG